MATLQEAFDQGFLVIKRYLDEEFARYEKRLAAFEANGLRYCGIWQRAQHYSRGSVVTLDGSAWIALRDTEGAPPGNDWQLMVRQGRDGKDAR